MPRSLLIESTSDSAEEIGDTLKHYGLEPESPESPETDEPKPSGEEKKETPAPEPEKPEPEGKTAAAQETAPKQEQVKEEPHREDFDTEEKFSEALEDWKDTQKPKGDGGWQKRIDRLTKKLGKSEAAREELQRKVDAKSSPAPPESKPAVEPAKAPKPKVEDFATYEEYGDANAEWIIAQRLGGKSIEELVKEQVDKEVAEKVEAKVKAIQEEQATQAILDAYRERQAESRERHPNWDDVVGNDEVQITPIMEQVMVRSKLGPEIAYHFGEHPDEAARIAALEPIEAALELGKIESTLAHQQKAAKATEAPKPEATPATPKPKVSAAPEPITPVKTKSASAVKDPSEMSPQEFTAWRNAGGGK